MDGTHFVRHQDGLCGVSECFRHSTAGSTEDDVIREMPRGTHDLFSQLTTFCAIQVVDVSNVQSSTQQLYSKGDVLRVSCVSSPSVLIGLVVSAVDGVIGAFPVKRLFVSPQRHSAGTSDLPGSRAFRKFVTKT